MTAKAPTPAQPPIKAFVVFNSGFPQYVLLDRADADICIDSEFSDSPEAEIREMQLVAPETPCETPQRKMREVATAGQLLAWEEESTKGEREWYKPFKAWERTLPAYQEGWAADDKAFKAGWQARAVLRSLWDGCASR